LYVAVHVSETPAANEVDGQLTADIVPVPENCVSFTVIPDNEVVPVFVTRKLYVTV